MRVGDMGGMGESFLCASLGGDIVELALGCASRPGALTPRKGPFIYFIYLFYLFIYFIYLFFFICNKKANGTMSNISTILLSTTIVESYSFFPHNKIKSFCLIKTLHVY